MSRDPYLDVKREVDNALSHSRDLYASYLRLARTSNNQQLISEAKQELTISLGLVELDLEDLEESVTAVEESGTRWGLSYEEVQSRRRALENVKADVREMLDTIADDQHTTPAPNQTNGRHRGSDPFSDVELGQASTAGRNTSNGNNAYSDDPYAERRSDEVEDYEMEQQQIMLQQQDTAVYRISNTLTTLAQQAGLIGQEVMVQNEMLDDLSTRVDATDNRLTRANKRMKEFIRKNEETYSSWCIVILIIVLIILLLLVILM
ncbi:hypothetical protein NCC49_005041 [Naganishia albida]|nr:hypothetical protein NCC49_005041 [Naganishia albida]